MRTAAQIEQERLVALPDTPQRTFALQDLTMTPGAVYAGLFLGELFYGVTANEVLVKVEEFIRDTGAQPVAEDACQPYPLPEA